MESFKKFMESDPNQTSDYIPRVGTSSTGSFAAPHMAGATNRNMGTTQVYRGATGSANGVERQGHPEVIAAQQGLRAAHTQLRDIFAKVRTKMDTFRSPKTKDSFERNLIAGIDGIGRAHAIILPTAKGDDGSESL